MTINSTIPESTLAQWRDRFPRVNVDAEAAVAEHWCREHLTKRTAATVARVVSSWLARAQREADEGTGSRLFLIGSSPEPVPVARRRDAAPRCTAPHGGCKVIDLMSWRRPGP